MKPTRASPATYALIEAARSEFIEQGYGGAKTREIARRAGTSEVTLFRHFGSKANLFRETVFQPVNDYLNEFIASELPADGPMEMSPENLRKFTSRLFEVITENAPLIKALVASFDYEDGDVSDIADLTSLNAYFSKSQSQLDLILSDESREIIKRSDIFVRIIFSSFLSLSLFGKWIFPEKNFDAREVVGIMQDMIIRGYGMDPSK